MPMYNMIECSSNYSEMKSSLWFYSKDKTINFDNDIANTVDFISFKYNAKLLENTEASEMLGILRNATIVVPLKYPSNFWRSL